MKNLCFQWQIQDFPEGGTNPRGEQKPISWPIFPEKSMKMKKFRAGVRTSLVFSYLSSTPVTLRQYGEAASTPQRNITDVRSLF